MENLQHDSLLGSQPSCSYVSYPQPRLASYLSAFHHFSISFTEDFQLHANV